MRRKLIFAGACTAFFMTALFLAGCAAGTPVTYDTLLPMPEYNEPSRQFDTAAPIQYMAFRDDRVNKAILEILEQNNYANVFTQNNYAAAPSDKVRIFAPLYCKVTNLSRPDGVYVEVHLIVMLRKPGFVMWNKLHTEKGRYFQAFSRKFMGYKFITPLDYEEVIRECAANLFKIDEFRAALETEKGPENAVFPQNLTPWDNLNTAIRSQVKPEVIRWAFLTSDSGDRRADRLLTAYLMGAENICGDNKGLLIQLTAMAENGAKLAQNKLAGLYENGIGTFADYKKAFYWYSKAAEQGVAHAQYKVGYFCEKGYGTDQDLREAVKWYARAAAQSHADASKRLQELRKMMQKKR